MTKLGIIAVLSTLFGPPSHWFLVCLQIPLSKGPHPCANKSRCLWAVGSKSVFDDEGGCGTMSLRNSKGTRGPMALIARPARSAQNALTIEYTPILN